MARAFFTAGNAGSDVEQPFAFDIFRPAIGVFEERVAAVDDDVPGFEVREELFDEFIDRLAGLDEEHHAAGALEVRDHFRDGAGADDPGALGLVGEELVNLFDGAVEGLPGLAGFFLAVVWGTICVSMLYRVTRNYFTMQRAESYEAAA